MKAVALPGDVVVSVHDAADSVEDEKEQHDEPVGQILAALPLCISHDECDERWNCSGL